MSSSSPKSLHGEVLVGEAVDYVHDSVEHLAARAPAADQLEALPDPHVLRLAGAALEEAVSRHVELARMPVPFQAVLPAVDAHAVAMRDAELVGDRLTLPGVALDELRQPRVGAVVDSRPQAHDPQEMNAGHRRFTPPAGQRDMREPAAGWSSP